MNYYNEFEPYCAQWLRNLINAGLIPKGEVDERSIELVQPDDLRGFSQCHFFAGIGGWSLALELAGWPEDRPVWTGSCPCQPFSAAGNQKAQADPRHLWPVWFSLIEKCGPPVIFGEQVEAAIAKGWLDEVANDLEKQGYAFASGVLPACSVTAPHRRNRLWFVADTGCQFRSWNKRNTGGKTTGERDEEAIYYQRCGQIGSPVGDSAQFTQREQDNTNHSISTCGNTWDVVSLSSPIACPVGNPNLTGPQGRLLLPERPYKRVTWTTGLEWWRGHDGKYRPIESGILPLANGVPGRVGKLRAAGNAIVPEVAAEVIKAYMEVVV